MKSLNVSLLVGIYAKRLKLCCDSEYEAVDQVWQFVEKITGKTKVQLLISKFIELSDEQEKLLESFIVQRVEQRKPLQYILGTVLFCGFEIKVTPPILIPRPETEEWVLWLIKMLHDAGMSQKQFKILDLCTGSGCIALALAKAFPQASVWGVDINPQAVMLAQENQHLLGLKNVNFMVSDLYDALPSDSFFDVIVSNPPYVLPKEFEVLQPEVKNWEDERALIIDPDQLLYKRILNDLKKRKILQSEFAGNGLPILVLEVGLQVEKIAKELIDSEFEGVQVHEDMYGRPRWLSAQI